MSKEPKRKVYLDYAASTPLDNKVFLTMKPFLTDKYANPSALYSASVESKKAVEDSRSIVAEALGTQTDTIFFTSGGTESINLALLGVTRYKLQAIPAEGCPGGTSSKYHIITTQIEHKAVLETVKKLENDGFEVTYLDVDNEGFVSIDQFKKALCPETILVSIQYANNEIGTIQPVADIGREILKFRNKVSSRLAVHSSQVKYPYFHVDACQAVSNLDLNVEKLHTDLMSFNGSKIYGPKGVGVLYKRRGVLIEPLMYGGGQEFGLRSGTENVAGIVGMGTAVEQVISQKSKVISQTIKLRNYFWSGLQKIIPQIKLNGSMISSKLELMSYNLRRLPNNLNVMLPGVDAEAFVIYMDEAGVQCSSGSACAEDSDEVSHVLKAVGLSAVESKSSIRFTLGNQTTKKDIDYVLKIFNEVVKMSSRLNR